MNGTVLVCIVVVTVSVVIATVYFVITMARLAEVAKKADETLNKINTEMENVQKFSSSVIDTLSFVPKTWVKIATSVLPILMTTFFKRKK